MATSSPASSPMRLVHVTDDRPGISRKKHGKHFSYYDAQGARITDEEELKRIRSLAVPPAYRKVWICPKANGHIQATGIDQRGRKQYRYHPQWRAQRDETKFEHILAFGESLPAIRARIETDMRRHGLAREKVLATVIMLLEKTLIRVGNAEYARDNKSYGLTTIRNQHVAVHGSEIRFRFKGKSGKEWNLAVHDRRIANVVKKCADVPGYELFKYIDEEGHIRDVTSADVNAYLKEIGGSEFTAKDFRTWAATVLAAIALAEYKKYDTAAEAKKNVVKAVENVARQLGNTPAICRKCYIHPEIMTAYSDGIFNEVVEQEIDAAFKQQYATLSEEEVMVLAFLKKTIKEIISPIYVIAGPVPAIHTALMDYRHKAGNDKKAASVPHCHTASVTIDPEIPAPRLCCHSSSNMLSATLEMIHRQNLTLTHPC